MTRNPMFDNLPEVDEQELIQRHGISQENYARYVEISAEPITIIGGGRGRPYSEDYIEGMVSFNAKDMFEEAARGNLRRLMRAIEFRSGLSESTIYKIMQYEEMYEDTIRAFEWALYDMINAPDFDLPTEVPELENLVEWFKRWVGSLEWIANFVGVKSNTLVAGMKRTEKLKAQCLEFANRWYAARCRQYQRVSQEDYEKRYIRHLRRREEKSAELLAEAERVADQSLRALIRTWEATPNGQIFLEDLEAMGKPAALRRSWECLRPHPELTGGDKFVLRNGLFRAERNYGDVGKPPSHLFEAQLDILIIQPPGDAEDLWPQY